MNREKQLWSDSLYWREELQNVRKEKEQTLEGCVALDARKRKPPPFL